MKTAITLISFVLFVLFRKLPLTHSVVIEQVKDKNGNPIFPGGRYYILPAITHSPNIGGGLKLIKTGNSNCPLTLLQESAETTRGLPVKFTIPGISPGIILTGTPLQINFTTPPGCAASSEWTVFEDEKINKTCVGIGGPEGHPGQKTQSGFFRIMGQGYQYKLVFCKTRITDCTDIGRFSVNGEGGSRLILSNTQPFQIGFVDSTKVE